MKPLYKIIIFLFILPTLAFSDVDTKYKHEKSKTISREYAVDADAIVRLKNKYGNMNITTWSKNKVEIDVKITVKGNDLDDVENQLEDITVSFDSGASFVDAETIIESQKSNWNWWGKSKNLNYKIDYIVRMPTSNKVDLNNRYGNIYLDKISGKSTINCDYGKINIGELNNDSNYINLDYCSTSTIGYAKNADINIDYSKLSIEKSESIKVNADYSTFNGGEIKNINFNTDYGSIRLEDVENVEGNGDYTGIKLGKVRKNLNLDSDYGSISIEELVKGFEQVVISAKYAGVRIGSNDDNNFNFEIDLQYGSFKRDKDLVDVFKSEEKSTKKYYEGVFGKGSKTSTVNIKSKYGSVTIQEN